MASDDQILDALAKNGDIDYSAWPALLERLLPKLEDIAHHDFPTPTIPISEPLSSGTKAGSRTPKSRSPSQGSNISQKENQPVSPSSPATTRPQPSPARAVAPPDGTLPPPLLSLLLSIQSTLRTTFTKAPPHTAQRLAELILRPTKHYRTLPSYLRALERIVSVSSPLSDFPLPSIPFASTSNSGLLNGSLTPERQDEETVSGATLTPIPWLSRNGSTSSSRPSTSSVHPHVPHNASTSDLRTESTTQIDGPNGAGSIETVTVSVNGLTPRSVSSMHTTSSVSNSNPVTQGELLRQEQEAGVVPVPVHTPMVSDMSPSIAAATGRATRGSSATAAGTAPDTRAATVSAATETATAETEAGEGPRVHARGPNVIGMEDMGPQVRGMGSGGLDIEGALGRRGEGEGMGTLLGSASEEKEEEEDEEEQEVGAKDGDGDGDVVLTDADGVAEGEDGADVMSQNVGSDAADSSAVP
ncbi:MAG: hypothetical protein Q9191_000100 [Dirinaria sp. TL-2023a]